jgi:hypothetical protein
MESMATQIAEGAVEIEGEVIEGGTQFSKQTPV